MLLADLRQRCLPSSRRLPTLEWCLHCYRRLLLRPVVQCAVWQHDGDLSERELPRTWAELFSAGGLLHGFELFEYERRLLLHLGSFVQLRILPQLTDSETEYEIE